MHKPTPPPTLLLAPCARSQEKALVERKHTQETGQESVGKEETANLSCSTTFRKTKETLSAADTVHPRIQRRHTSFRILPQEGKEAWSRCIHTMPEKASESINISRMMKGFLSWRQLIKLREGECYFKCKKSNAKLQVTWKMKETRHHQKFTIIKPKDMAIYNLPNKEFKIGVLRKLNQL